jgi:asparagine synthase (glutamine-hydrolysing)
MIGGTTNDPAPVSPLASQPIVEACLKIASYLHLRDAQNRAVARAAFGDRLSPTVLHRGRGKGAPTVWVQEVIARNRAFLREYLLDGVLVQKGILDRRKVERVLAPNIDSPSGAISDVFAQLYVETWVRQWSP